MTQRGLARIAGVLYLIVAVCGGYSQLFVREKLVVRRARRRGRHRGAHESAGLWRLGMAAIGEISLVLWLLAGRIRAVTPAATPAAVAA